MWIIAAIYKLMSPNINAKIVETHTLFKFHFSILFLRACALFYILPTEEGPGRL